MKVVDRNEAFTLSPAGPEGGDCTRPYHVTLHKDFTVEELIRMIKDSVNGYGQKEWGCIDIYKDIPPFRDGRCEYRHGEIISNDIPKEILNKKVISVRASGGYSRMDYMVKV